MRETLFNWLEPHISGARCLDLFAGTGVLGFEAISRGAESATLVELNAVAAQQLSANKASFDAENIEIVHADVIQWLNLVPTPFDIVFVDPPFDRGYVSMTARLLERGWLKPANLVYVEGERGFSRDELPKNWRVVRENETRHVSYALMRREIG